MHYLCQRVLNFYEYSKRIITYIKNTLILREIVRAAFEKIAKKTKNRNSEVLLWLADFNQTDIETLRVLERRIVRRILWASKGEGKIGKKAT